MANEEIDSERKEQQLRFFLWLLLLLCFFETFPVAPIRLCVSFKGDARRQRTAGNLSAGYCATCAEAPKQ